LFAGGKFTGKCHHCGQYGHRIVPCWLKDPNKKPNGCGGHGGGPQQNSASRRGGNNQAGRGAQGGQRGGRFGGTCHFCQELGHQIKDCHKKKRDEGGETAATATSQPYKNNNNSGNGNNNSHNNSSSYPNTEMAEMMCIAVDLEDFKEDDLPSNEFEDLLELEYKLLTQDEASDDKKDEKSEEESSEESEELDPDYYEGTGVFTKKELDEQ
jgi:hypothetical protein